MIKNGQLEVLFKSLAKGRSITDACVMARIARDTFYKRYESDPEFKARVKEVESEWKYDLLERIKKAGNNDRNWTANAWILERKFAKDFAIKQKLEHTGVDGQPIKFIIIKKENKEKAD